MKLTPSQWRSLVMGILAAAAALVQYAPQLEAAWPDVKWIAPAVTVAGLVVTMISRSLKTDNSGTGTGLIESGPDVRAATVVPAQASDAPTPLQSAGNGTSASGQD